MDKYYAGVDSGSSATKAAVIGEGGLVLGAAVSRSGADLRGSARRALRAALKKAGLRREQLAALWATGFGRRNVDFANGTRTELDCHARGVRHAVSGPLTIVDVGGQDTKIIRLDERGRRVGHKMNRKCAAGTGSSLEEVALRLNVPLGRLDRMASRYREELELGSFCAVFTATELLAAIRRGKRPEDLARAAFKSVLKRVLEMAPLAGKVVATGGVVAHSKTFVELLAAELDGELVVPPYPQEIGAIGAALAARENGAVARSGKDR